ncbi:MULTISPECIES: hypothetical protein [Streptomyces]|uniref:Secreted protein n=2 Tax=Streptomyces rimosus subsp. rimosus TaxID=132474 RepID=L8EI64_STRR1|nr:MULTISPECIES: hypothetical protein [Streptomyces]KOG79764.1 hypothetical protein ADK78_05945 [Kitasatospora aureofaciens]MYT45428.1 hypothetical protein [Streptomyces sp. SID5471]KEF05994.1 hypothetical protein DF17_15730 [Streptomyces rimosus]KEF18996.1 hypothetical protein DF18_19175 [Streptomyces rimosus]KOT43293.1 hypothetical protein ADK42_08165 [Streptomyces rimosus subsp. rimosus]
MKYVKAAALLAGAALSVGAAAPAFATPAYADRTGAEKFKSGVSGTAEDVQRAVTSLGDGVKKINGTLRGDERVGHMIGDSAASNAPSADGIGLQAASMGS